MLRYSFRWMSAVGLIGLGLFAAAPASAAPPPVTTCPAPNTVQINGGTTIYLQPTGAVDQTSGSQIFEATFPLTVVCITSLGAQPLQGVSLAVSATLAPGAPKDVQVAVDTSGYTTLQPGITFNGFLPSGTTNLGVLPATGNKGNVQVTLFAFSPKDLPYLPAANNFTGFVGLQFDAAVVTSGVNTSTQQEGIGEIFATPELESFALFGAGAAGLASYALLKARARRRPIPAAE